MPRLIDIVSEYKSSPDRKRLRYSRNIYGLGIINKESIAVQELYMPKDCELSDIQSESAIWAHVFSGNVTLVIGHHARQMSFADAAYIQPELEFSLHAEENSWLLLVSIPADAGFPSAPVQPNDFVKLNASIISGIINNASESDIVDMVKLLDEESCLLINRLLSEK